MQEKLTNLLISKCFSGRPKLTICRQP